MLVRQELLQFARRWLRRQRKASRVLPDALRVARPSREQMSYACTRVRESLP